MAFGLVCAIVYMLAAGIRSEFNSLYFWAVNAAYGLLLTKWAGTETCSIVLPLAAQLAAAFMIPSTGYYVLLSLIFLSWMRSGPCLDAAFPGVLVKELVLCLGGYTLITLLAPRSTLTWGLAIWMFFLIQSLYFIHLNRLGKAGEIDRYAFELKMKKIDGVLSRID